MPYEHELEVALAAAAKAGELILSEYATFAAIPNAPANISTAVDLASQEVILLHLREHFPDDSLCAEEATGTLGAAPAGRGRLWVVDPIDGTRGFVKKNGQFSVMIGLIADGAVVLGVVLEPGAGRFTFATAGGGCWQRHGGEGDQPCRVRETASLSDAILTQSHSKPGVPSEAVRRLAPRTVIETYSAGIKLAQVARGEADLYVNTAGFKDWDVCAGQLLVEEAGGVVTDLRGEPLRYGAPGFRQSHGLIAANPALHAEVVKRYNSPTSP
ncbi:MAG TPA: 3'(2'),5'-bisphosphate nucleotidase CysQ [Gemmataceae bacterium]